jgi:uncharacterized protein DUF4238
MANQHYVSRFLTKNWEVERERQRLLVYYDSQLDRFEEAKSRDLFAEPDLHSEKIERRLHELIEDPLARLWHRVRKEGVEQITDWREIRAAHLVFLVQPPRILDRYRDRSIEESKLEDLLGRDDAFLDGLVQFQMNEYDLRLFSMPMQEERQPRSRIAGLFYPQVGMFGFPLTEDPGKKPLGGITAGLGIPLHPQILLTTTPKTVYQPSLASVREMFQAFSIGPDDCRKVVIPATTLNSYPRGDLVTRIKGMRYAANELVKAMTRMKQLIDQVPQADRARVIRVVGARFADPSNADTIRLV